MNSSFASGLVRRWVAVYTIGLPADLRAARSDEIESDLWSQNEEAEATGRSDRALAVEILVRLVLGIGADVAWRIERRRSAHKSIERSTTMSTRIIALLAIVGGLGLCVAIADWVVTDAHPDHEAGWTVMKVIALAGLVAIGLSLGLLGAVLISRNYSVIGVVALVGGTGGVLSLIQAYGALALLPPASAVVVTYLAWIGVVHWPFALVQLASAPCLVLGIAAYSNPGLAGVAIALTLLYCMSWIAIAVELLVRGLPQARPAAQSVG